MSSTMKFNPFTHKLDFTGTGGAGGAKFSAVTSQVFTSSGTYTPTTGMAYCLIQCIGGGGAGGGAEATGLNFQSSGSGGGGGEYAQGIFTNASIGASQAVTIGAGGTGVSGANGNNGTNTSVGAIISAFGGHGGITQPSTNVPGFQQGGAGGSGGAGGDFRTPGQNGLYTYSAFTGGINNLTGTGANTQYGSGGLIGKSVTGGNAGGYGAGGGGASNDSNGVVALAGGNGSAGIVIITEYIST